MNQLILAVAKSDVEEVKDLLSSGYDEGIDDALLRAVGSVNPDSVGVTEVLLQGGANPNAKNKDGETPLIILAKEDGDGVAWARDIIRDKINLLIRAGADPNLKDNTGHTALMYSAQNNGPMLTKFITRSDVNVTNNEGLTAYDLCTNYSCRRDIEEKDKGQYKYHYNREVTKSSKTMSKYTKLPEPIHRKILIQRDQQVFCSSLENTKHIGSLKGIAELLGLEYPRDITKTQLCQMISHYLATHDYLQ